MTKRFHTLRHHIPRYAPVCGGVFLCCLALSLGFRASPAFADLFNRTAGSGVRLFLTKVSGLLPFSIAELMLLYLPALVVYLCVHAVRAKHSIRRFLLRFLCGVLSAAAIFYALFVCTMAPGYRGSPLAHRLGLVRRDVTAEELYDAINIVIDEVNAAAAEVKFSADGSSPMPVDLFTLSDTLSDAYRTVGEKYAFLSFDSAKVKPLFISRWMTYTHISGVYSFFTGEANLNTNYPDYVCVYSAAHEMAHQRGVAREDEANFVAFLVCISSEDPYLRYSGYLSMYSYLSSALGKADAALRQNAAARLCDEARGELFAYSAFFDAYRESTAAKVADTVNDTYLKGQGTVGAASYGMVADLAVVYLLG